MIGRLAGLLGAGALVIVLVLTLDAAQRGAPPGLRVFQPLITVSVPSPGGPPQPQGTPPAVPTPPATTPAYPPPGPTMTPPGPPTAVPTPTRVVLPPLPPAPTPGPFRDLGILFSNAQLLGYRTITVAGTDEIMLEPWPPEPRSQPNAAGLLVAPDGRRILYTLWNNMNQRQAAIWTMNPDGSDKRLLVAATDEWFPEEAIWSPDGTQIAYRRAYLAGSYDEGARTRLGGLSAISASAAQACSRACQAWPREPQTLARLMWSSRSRSGQAASSASAS